ncbi:hypothetical protein CE91St33_01240 [Eggerthella lenta]|nr:hypothetical protein CE91St33_01240 [Eggerthella lenta]
MAKPNPRRSNGARRDALRKRVAAMGLPCHICGLPIDYSLTTYVDPTDGKTKRHPMSFELDELVPVSKGGNPLDISNVAPSHRICNQRRGNKTLRKHPEPTADRLPKSREW